MPMFTVFTRLKEIIINLHRHTTYNAYNSGAISFKLSQHSLSLSKYIYTYCFTNIVKTNYTTPQEKMGKKHY